MKTLVALACCLALSAQAETFNAKVIVVMDGDTVMVLREGGSEAAGSPPASPLRGLRNGKKIKIRLANIDAPEKAQPFGKQARDSLQELVGKKQIQIDSRAVDQYGRTVGFIKVDGLNVNQEQVRRGMAWDYSHFHTDKIYVGLQSDARRARRGLWAQPNPQAPWQWRKLHPSVKTVTLADRRHRASSDSGHVVRHGMRQEEPLHANELMRRSLFLLHPLRCDSAGRKSRRNTVPGFVREMKALRALQSMLSIAG